MTDAPREGEPTGPTVNDRRRIDPQTGQVREPQETAAPATGADVPDDVSSLTDPAPDSPGSPSPADPQIAELQTALSERTLDLQRLQAEYVNYKRRVDRDRELTRQLGTEAVLRDLLDVLDGVNTARAHEELTGGFKSLAENLEKVAARYGLTAFGEKGDPFDPQIHEALMHAHAEDITGPTCVEILQQGYKVKDKVLRPARVAVAEPSGPSPAADPS